MDKQIQYRGKLTPDYKQIYMDILELKFPEKMDRCKSLLNKNHLSALDVQKLNQMVFGTSNKELTGNGKHRSYSKSDILQMLGYQKKHNLNNSQLAEKFNLSRNSITKWKRIFVCL
ncbi:helix-turn-helix domain-containing protein [Chryseobacterium sp. c4a]|uniref:helix-turn-helix domain-containing protein n=1 Tax=Chryseobacterium sp. c4a TaxID=1573582 RepID=UPI001358441F|nr:helix-turn-helix domain-containing protein [Chryseobacterium sp. c4a]